MALKQVIDVGGQGEAPRSRDIAGSGSAYAKDTNFDPTNTDFESTQLQALGEEIDGALGTKASKSNLSNYILTGTKPSTALSNGTFFVDKDGALRVATADIATTDDVGSGNSAVKSVGEVLSELNSNLSNSCGFVNFRDRIGGNSQYDYIESFISYIATENCYVIVSQNVTGTIEGQIKIDNTIVGRIYDQNQSTKGYVFGYYLAKGQTISANSYVNIHAYSLIN